MSLEPTTNRVKPWYRTDHRYLRPFSDPVGQSWCRHCQEWGTGKTEARYEGSVYASKTWCRRCGRVIAYGVYNQALDAEGGRRAQAWATAP